MHVAEIPNHGSKPTFLLRETFRKDGKVQHRTIGNVTHLDPKIIEQMRHALKGRELVPIDSIFKIKKSTPHGHVQAILDAIRHLGLDKMIDSKPSKNRDLILAMVAQRIISPKSKLGTSQAWHNTTMGAELNVLTYDQDDLYDAMDWLFKRQENIEKKLAKKHLEEGSMALYDISSSYVEGERCPLAQYGYNRDGKEGKKIIVYGLLCNEQGIPVSIQAYPGNTADSTTIPNQAEKLQNQFGLKDVVLVGDRGMLTGTQIEKLKQYPGIKHISALRGDSVRKFIETGLVARSLFDKKNLAEIQSKDFPGERLIVCHNPLLEARRIHKREELLVATEKLLQTLKERFDKRTAKGKIYTDSELGIRIGKVLNKKKVAKHFYMDVQSGSFSFRRNEESILKEGQVDGLYAIRTNLDASVRSADDVVRDYKRLGDVEKSFRTMKTTLLDVRPIYHHVENRVRTHLFVCMLAYYVVLHLRGAWSTFLYSDENLSESRANRDPVLRAEPSESVKEKKSRLGIPNAGGLPESPQTLETLLDHLATCCRNTCVLKDSSDTRTFEMVTSPTLFQEELFKRAKAIGKPAEQHVATDKEQM